MPNRMTVGFMLALIVSPVTAQAQKRATSAQEVEAIAACRQVTDSVQRLACYDRASESLARAVERREVLVMGKEEIKETRRSLFGFSMPRLPFLGSGEDDQDEIATNITSAANLGMGKWQLRLEDGSLWQTTETIGFLRDPKAGQKIEIERGALGNYFIRINGQRAVRGKRVG
jgi:hypothetical protein